MWRNHHPRTGVVRHGESGRIGALPRRSGTRRNGPAFANSVHHGQQGRPHRPRRGRGTCPMAAGEKIGYLPGTAEEKLHPYLLPILDEINHFISSAQYATLRLNNKIEVVPLGLMRGRNFHHSFIVADECQNASYDQLKMLLTRTGQESKMVLTGDIGQSDLSRHLQGGFIDMIHNLDGLEGIGVSQLMASDIVRNPIIAKILGRLESYESRK